MLRDCFTYQNSADGFFRLEEDDVFPEPLSVGLKMNMMYLQWDITNTSVWSDVAFTKENVINMTNIFDIGCLQEAYFAIQDGGCLCHLHVRFAQRYLKYLVPCATDSRFDMSKAMVIFGHKAEFYKDVCRAYGFYDT
jgi:hypothetical protein